MDGMVEELKDAVMMGLTSIPEQPIEENPIPKVSKRVNPRSIERKKKELKQKFDKKVNPTDDEVYKKLLVSKISKYHSHFPSLSIKRKVSLEWKVKELEEEYSRCQDTLNTENCVEQIKSLDNLLNLVLENIMLSFGKTYASGFYQKCFEMQDTFFDQELHELAIKYEEWLAHGPEFRLLYKKVQIMMEMRNVTMGMNNLKMNNLKQPIDPSEYADL